METYLAAPFSGNERAVVSKVCRKLLNKIIRPSLAAPYVVAIGKRNLLWDLLPDHIEEHILEVYSKDTSLQIQANTHSCLLRMRQWKHLT